MPVTNGIFYEQQRGGLCRMHALNAFFGESLINEQTFQKYMTDFDGQMKAKFNETASCKDFDLVNSDQNNIISYILKKKGCYARYIPLNGLQGKQLPLEDIRGDFIFVYNESHIWGLKKHQDMWWSVDSMRGVKKVNIYRIPRQKNIGFMIPVNMKKELFHHTKEIKNILEKENITTKDDIKTYLKKLNERKEILGDLEVPLGVAMDLVEAQINGTNRSPLYQPIYDLNKLYNKFLDDFIEKKYSLEVLTEYVPDMLSSLMKLCFAIDIM